MDEVDLENDILSINNSKKDNSKDLEYAATVDGCTHFQAFYKIVPQAWPGIVTTFILLLW